MRLFVSYARVDKPYCIQIVDMLDVHETWYDQRLYAGQNWWKEILRRLDWCEGFIYLLSPESVKSEYCRREFELAQSLGRHIFPAIVHPNVDIPQMLKEIQYADLSKGLTAEAVKTLLNAIHLASRNTKGANKQSVNTAPDVNIQSPAKDPATVIGMAATAMEKGQFDQAVFLLKQAKANGYKSKFINIDAIMSEAEAALERQSYLREAEREYKQIAMLVKYKPTLKLGQEAFHSFQKEFPDYDPENLAEQCRVNGESKPVATGFKLPLLQWCQVSAGNVCFEFADNIGELQSRDFHVEAFSLSKYPVTNAQYQVFLDDPYGYGNMEWWQFSTAAYQWRKDHPHSYDAKFKGDERPREMVTWYDAVAFCEWLSDRLHKKVMLPTLAEWQRGYQGDTRFKFPWGNQFKADFCNTAESSIKMTSIVTRYEQNVSPYGVCDMAGNVWEWCRNTGIEGDFIEAFQLNSKRVVRGGSYMSQANRSAISFHYALNPSNLHSSIGFRIALYD